MNDGTKLTGLMIVSFILIGTFSLVGFTDITSGEEPGDSVDDPTPEYPKAIIDTSFGNITVELYNDKAPKTCENFIKYTNDRFYNDLIFHRVIDAFVIQGGGFDENLNQKPPIYPPIDLEIHEDLRHVDGALAMARTSDPNSATSQFYICDGAQPFLDDDYAVFGLVISGIDVVRSISAVNTTTENGMGDVPVDDVFIYSVKIEGNIEVNDDDDTLRPNLLFAEKIQHLNEVEPDQLTTLKVKIKNNGQADAQDVVVSLVVDGEEVQRRSLSVVPLTQPKYVAFDWMAKNGTKETQDIEVVIDPDNTIDEFNEDDNVVYSTIEVSDPEPIKEEEIKKNTPGFGAIGLVIMMTACIILITRKNSH